VNCRHWDADWGLTIRFGGLFKGAGTQNRLYTGNGMETGPLFCGEGLISFSDWQLEEMFVVPFEPVAKVGYCEPSVRRTGSAFSQAKALRNVHF
jgi:hypothetical protein